MTSAFWDDLAADLDDPRFLREYVRESVRVSTVDALVNALDAARAAQGLSKADLARAVGAEPAAVRRLLAPGNTGPNPTVGTLVELAAALGLTVRLEPLPEDVRATVAEALRTGRADPAALARLGDRPDPAG
ncbi:helix-turn-helix domain-containing protein [Actinomadura craniellae]|uniref:helix-turn-helix domain-containing protein n=1 Tax=Actinomadura craniellae TaxID=2231787 RepID=UPI0018F21796|nr:helix-turn-helix transcriptional regulator [Actinomadura craniellae]